MSAECSAAARPRSAFARRARSPWRARSALTRHRVAASIWALLARVGIRCVSEHEALEADAPRSVEAEATPVDSAATSAATSAERKVAPLIGPSLPLRASAAARYAPNG